MLTTSKLGLTVLAGTTLLAGSQAAIAQVLEEVIVTAQRREQSLQEVPVSIEAFRRSGDPETRLQGPQRAWDIFAIRLHLR